MNKLIIDNEFDIVDVIVDQDTDMEVNLDNVEKNLVFHITNGVNFKGFINTTNTKNKISYLVDENAQVVINKLAQDTSDEIEINLNGINSRVKYNTSVINYDNNSYKQVVRHNSPNTEIKINNHAINVEDNEFKFIVDGIIERNSSKADFKQDNRIINLKDGKSNILPNLIVDNDDIEASHSAYIGTFDEEAKFYMMSRGITEKECDDLLIKAFLLNNMDLDEKERSIYVGKIEQINK
jgi:hypothetical protein